MREHYRLLLLRVPARRALRAKLGGRVLPECHLQRGMLHRRRGKGKTPSPRKTKPSRRLKPRRQAFNERDWSVGARGAVGLAGVCVCYRRHEHLLTKCIVFFSEPCVPSPGAGVCQNSTSCPECCTVDEEEPKRPFCLFLLLSACSIFSLNCFVSFFPIRPLFVERYFFVIGRDRVDAVTRRARATAVEISGALPTSARGSASTRIPAKACESVGASYIAG